MTASPFPPGTEIGGCRVEKALGAGAMGMVYRARHLALDKPVALKVLSASWSQDKVFVQRFLQEARAAAKLEHPNIIGVYNVGQEKGTYFIVMQFVEGESLQDRVERERKMALTPATRIIRAVAMALAEAHAKGIVHRDIKTANIMLDKGGRPHVADFGLARTVEADSGLTVPGTVMGTPGYIAPEVIQGGAADYRADVYAMGVMYYYLLSGTIPFKGKTAYEIFSKQLTEKPAPLHQLVPEVPAEISAIVHKAMERDPNARYPAMSDFIRDIDAAWQRLSAGRTPALQTAAPTPVSSTARRGSAWQSHLEEVERKDRRKRLAGNVAGWVFLVASFLLAFGLASGGARAVRPEEPVSALSSLTRPFSPEDGQWLPRIAFLLLTAMAFSAGMLCNWRQFTVSASPVLSSFFAAVALLAFYVGTFLKAVPIGGDEGVSWGGLASALPVGFWTPVNGFLLGLAALGGGLAAVLQIRRRDLRWGIGGTLTVLGWLGIFHFASAGVLASFPEEVSRWKAPFRNLGSYGVFLLLSLAGMAMFVLCLELWENLSVSRMLSVLSFGIATVGLYFFSSLCASAEAITALGWRDVLLLPFTDLAAMLESQSGYLGATVALLVWSVALQYMPRRSWAG